MADQAYGAVSRQGDQEVVGTVAVVVHPDRLASWVGIRDQGGHVEENSDGVETLGKQPHPLARDGVYLQHVLLTLGGGACGDDALLSWEVPAPRMGPERAQAVRDEACEFPLGEPCQPVAEGRVWDATEARQSLVPPQRQGVRRTGVRACP